IKQDLTEVAELMSIGSPVEFLPYGEAYYLSYSHCKKNQSQYSLKFMNHYIEEDYFSAPCSLIVGMSGGPVIDVKSGEIVGVNSQILGSSISLYSNMSGLNNCFDNGELNLNYCSFSF